jgi:hypothetical protein
MGITDMGPDYVEDNGERIEDCTDYLYDSYRDDNRLDEI